MDDLKILKQIFDDAVKSLPYHNEYGVSYNRPNWIKDFEWYIQKKIEEEKEFIKEREMEL